MEECLSFKSSLSLSSDLASYRLDETWYEKEEFSGHLRLLAICGYFNDRATIGLRRAGGPSHGPGLPG